MIRRVPSIHPPAVRDTLPPTTGVTYDTAFWLSYVANLAIMTGHSLLFRYADVVFFFGGGELLLGWIVGIGMVGSLVMRVAQGVGIDRYGPRKMWLLSSLLFIVSCLGHLFVTQAEGPLIFLLRIGYNCSIAGFFGASITFISARAPRARMAEVVGMLGTSGFLAMVLGTALGDALLGGAPMTLYGLRLMFVLAAALGGVNMLLCALATRRESFQPRSRHVSPFGLMRRYHPGAVLLASAATGFGLSLPGTFLRPYAESIGIPGIALFFAVYCPTAFCSRFLARGLPARIGNRRVLYLGLTAMVAGMLLFTVATNQWLLCLPAAFLGVAHALLFPSVIAAGTAPFPMRYRGLATTLVLAMFDLGTFVGSPIAGAILSYSFLVDLPPFPTMFVSVAGMIGACAIAYALSRPRVALPDTRSGITVLGPPAGQAAGRTISR
ncbi:MAG TPA: MFS transporter [Pirellulales bacterium]|jgi:MFS family permease